ncbi:DNA-binding transcriptional regulator, AcrR family [Mucilaginibacter gossypiicola]|uniref:DNA-binding transcriptional regulator, AcrR family n=1 Tax=Mucilaginibacter gossypiicola TaxID=551995 RepID=A0A1H8QSS9_9SPHI|nr:TetR/AcrR family transcriptional regulator [Mucilaginibacter gossypiicola]SEO57280.1 DNA-binding transcriptional regulator, AcrR family [Mucilaginibacter gossypiicola]
MIAHSNISEKNEAILQASLRLFVEYGFHGTPTSKIAAEAGTAHGTIFTYYKTKDDLIAALYEYVKNEFRDFLVKNVRGEGTIKERLRDLFFYSVQWSLDNRKEFYFTQQFQYSTHLKKASTESIVKEKSLHRAIYQEALDNKVFRPLPLEMIAELAMSQMIGMFQFLSEVNYPPAETKALIDEAFTGMWRMLAVA